MSNIPDNGWTIERFLERLSSDEPVPGGGSAAALAGSLGCALGAMACRITLKRRTLSTGGRAHLTRSLQELDQLVAKMERLIKDDARAYGSLVRAFKLQRRVGAARMAAIRAPVRICEAAADAHEIITGLEPFASTLLRSDLRAGRALLRGAFQAAEMTARINFVGKDVPADAVRFRSKLAQLRERMR